MPSRQAVQLPRDRHAVVDSLEDLGGGLFSLVLRFAEPFHADPGQFVLIRDARWGSDPLLGRPLAVAWQKKTTAGLLFQVRGRGTEAFSSLEEGATLEVRGPQGRGFPVPAGERLLLAAGAMGLAPLLFAWERYGASRPGELLLGVSCSRWTGLVEWLHRRGVPCTVACDDGSIGRKGTVVDLLERLIRKEDEVWACGPQAMMVAVADLAPARFFVSLEARMACGYGGCLGCVVPTRSGRLRACVDGPVFDGREVLWNDLLH